MLSTCMPVIIVLVSFVVVSLVLGYLHDNKVIAFAKHSRHQALEELERAYDLAVFIALKGEMKVYRNYIYNVIPSLSRKYSDSIESYDVLYSKSRSEIRSVLNSIYYNTYDVKTVRETKNDIESFFTSVDWLEKTNHQFNIYILQENVYKRYISNICKVAKTIYKYKHVDDIIDSRTTRILNASVEQLTKFIPDAKDILNSKGDEVSWIIKEKIN